MADDEHWYFINVDNISEKIALLASRGIPSMDITVVNPRGDRVHGISLPSSLASREILGLIGLDLTKNYTAVPTSSRNVSLLEMANETKTDGTEDTVIIPHSGTELKNPGENFEAWDDIVPVLEAVRRCFGITPVVDNPHGNSRSPKPAPKDTLPIHFYSVSEGSARGTISSAFGIPLETHQSMYMVPAFHGTSISDDARHTLAEIVDGNLYVLFDLPHVGGVHTTQIFAKIIEEYFRISGKTKEELTKFAETVDERVDFMSRSAFVNGCGELIRLNTRRINENMRDHEAIVTECMSKITQSSRMLVMLQKHKDMLNGNDGEMKVWADHEYNTLKTIPDVRRVVLSGATISLFTNQIDIKHANHVYHMGKFRIDIHTDGGSGGVKIFNLTQRRGDFNHPHIRASGNCCFGNIDGAVAKLISEYQYVVLAQLMIDYLHSYNSNGAFTKIENWG